MAASRPTQPRPRRPWATSAPRRMRPGWPRLRQGARRLRGSNSFTSPTWGFVRSIFDGSAAGRWLATFRTARFRAGLSPGYRLVAAQGSRRKKGSCGATGASLIRASTGNTPSGRAMTGLRSSSAISGRSSTRQDTRSSVSRSAAMSAGGLPRWPSSGGAARMAWMAWISLSASVSVRGSGGRPDRRASRWRPRRVRRRPGGRTRGRA